jgi:tetratricopeptide (TPR) repeat protein
VKKIVGYYRNLFMMLLFLSLFLCLNNGFTQLDDFEELPGTEEEVKCIPEDLTTYYDQFKSDSLPPNQLGIWYSLAREDYKYKNYDHAVPYYWKILVNDTSDRFKVAYSKLAECYYNLSKPDSVLIVCYRGLEKYPDNSSLHYWAGFVHVALQNTKCAIPHYEALVKLSPTEKSYWAKLAFLYYNNDDCRAVDAQRKVVELDPDDNEARVLLGEFEEHCGVNPFETKKKAYYNDPNNVQIAMDFAKTAFEQGLYQEAIKPLNSVLKNEPKYTVAMEYLGRCYEGLGQLSTSLKYYRDILQIDPKNVNVICLTASVYGRLHEFTTARSYVWKAQKIDRGNGLPSMIMSEIYENAVIYCSEKRKENDIKYDDKLVWKLAQDELRKAAKDPNFAQDAQRRIKQFDTLIPTPEDRFMHKNRDKTTEPCYDWIN